MRTPFTYTLIAINVVVFGLQLAAAGSTGDVGLIGEYSMIPDLALDEPQRWITSAFLHANVSHLAVNMVSLWALGVSLERYIGSVRFILVYLIGALGGSAAVFFLEDPSVRTVGASGAIFALVGAGVVAHIKAKEFPLYELGVFVVGVVWAYMADNGTSWQAHLGGFILGIALGVIFVFLTPRRPRQRREEDAARQMPSDPNYPPLENGR